VSAGETIVTAGQLKLRDGAPVTIAATNPSGDATAKATPNGTPPAKAESATPPPAPKS
jgi:hypothetical protein